MIVFLNIGGFVMPMWSQTCYAFKQETAKYNSRFWDHDILPPAFWSETFSVFRFFFDQFWCETFTVIAWLTTYDYWLLLRNFAPVLVWNFTELTPFDLLWNGLMSLGALVTSNGSQIYEHKIKQAVVGLIPLKLHSKCFWKKENLVKIKKEQSHMIYFKLSIPWEWSARSVRSNVLMNWY